MLYFFDPITGLPVANVGQDGLVTLPFRALQATLIHFHDNHFLKPILILDSSEKVRRVIPDLKPALRSAAVILIRINRYTFFPNLEYPS